jgi:excisionase family DNA binding protein
MNANRLLAHVRALRAGVDLIRLLTAEQLAARWQVKPSHVYRLAREGELPVVKIGRYRRFRLDAIERWEAEQA